jgi:hypothetical protein
MGEGSSALLPSGRRAAVRFPLESSRLKGRTKLSLIIQKRLRNACDSHFDDIFWPTGHREANTSARCRQKCALI